MKIIAPVEVDGSFVISEPAPPNAVKIVFSGENFIVYEDGDEVPEDDYCAYQPEDELPPVPDE